MYIFDKEYLPEHWAWWKDRIRLHFEHHRALRKPNDINGFGLWAKFSYIITNPFYVWFHWTCYIPTSFLRWFIFDHFDDNRPEGFWKPEASLSKRVFIYIIAIPQMMLFGLLALCFLLIGLAPINVAIFISIGLLGVFF